MHVLLIPSEEFQPVNSHLAGIFQKHQANALQNLGCTVGVLSIRQSLSIPMILKAVLFKVFGFRVVNELSGKKIPELIDVLLSKSFNPSRFIHFEENDGVNITRIDGFYFLPPSKHWNHLGWLIAGKVAWKKYCNKYGNPDVIHAHNACYGGLLASVIKKDHGVPYCLTEHSSYIVRGLESNFLYKHIRVAYQHANSLIVVSKFLGNNINRIYGQAINWKVIPNVLDPLIENAVEPKVIATTPFVFVAIGSLIELKRHGDLINAFNAEFKENEDVQLLIAGDGDLKCELEKQIQHLGVEDKVKLLDRLSREKIITLIDSSHCLVLGSSIETFGVVIIEALSRGKPVVATKCGGPESILSSSNGVLCEVGDYRSLGDGMRFVLSNYDSFNKEQIRRHTLAEYGGMEVGKKLLNVYESISK